MKISEVSKKYGISEDTLRYYEKIGLIPKVHRNKSGVREYTEEDCRWIEFIKCMREAGVQIEALVRYVKLFQQGDKTIEERKKILMEQREQLISRLKDIQKALDKLNLKIEAYETIIVPAEKKLKGEEKVGL
ncbi:MAG: MerR family transcriptional regulator [Dictyoglomaceae bacterium]